jgi:predicted ATPase/class 3 adenylate cyclase/uncharacterized membrane protein YuzA (DUF378 family)
MRCVSFVWKLQDRGRVDFDKKSTWKPEENNIMTGEISTVALPSGTVTFLFTDIEGSTRLLHELGDRYPDLLAEQRGILRKAFSQHNGSEVDTQGDAFFYAFPRATDAVLAAVAAQEAISQREWPANVELRVRMGLHTGESLEVGPEGYVGMDVHRAARIAHAGHGGQILLSASTTAIIEHDLPGELHLKDLGEHRLKDLQHPLHLFQLRSKELPSEFPPLRSLNVLPNNLPHQLSTFIGRQAEIQQVLDLLGEARLVTLVGPGGAGKTRLSLQVAAELVDQFSHGVWFVELSALDSPDFLVSALISALPFQVDVYSSDLEPEDQLLDYLKNRTCLLLMDNFEHLVAGGKFLVKLLEHAPELRILVTSRERLNLREEWVFELAGMSFPSNGDQGAEAYSAVQLFSERARQIDPAFEFSGDNRNAVFRICRRVEGMPLAIELATAWLKTLSPDEIAQEIERNMDILTTSMRNQPDKHRSLRAVFDHSWELLTDEERTGFERMSIFRGGFTREAGEQITGASLQLLSNLLDKSLLRRTGQDRYAFHELLRQYALENLAHDPEGMNQALERHCNYYTDFLRDRRPLLDRSGMLEVRDEIIVELNNIRVATSFALKHWDQERVRALLGDLAAFYNTHGYHDGLQAFEAIIEQLEIQKSADLEDSQTSTELLAARVYQSVLMSALGTSGGEELASACLPELRVRELAPEVGICLQALGTYAGLRSSYDEAIILLSEAAELAKQASDIFSIAACLAWLGWAYYERGEYDKAGEIFTEGYQICVDSGQRLGEAFLLSKLGTWADARHDYREALGYHGKAQEIFIEFHDLAGQGYVLTRMSLSAWGLGDYEGAVRYGEAALEQFETIGHRWGIATSLCRIGFAVIGLEDLERAEVYFTRGLERSVEYRFPSTTIYALIGLAGVWWRKGEHERALEILFYAMKQPTTPGLYKDIARAEFEAAIKGFDEDSVRRVEESAVNLDLDKIVRGVLRAQVASSQQGLEVSGETDIQ